MIPYFKRFLFFILVVYAEFFSNALKLTVPEKRVRVQEFVQCPGKENLPVVFENVVLSHTQQHNIDISGKVLLKKVLDNLTGVVELHKCRSKEDVGTCEYYTRVTINAICEKFELFKDYLKKTTFPTKCPLPAGEYFINHTTIDKKTLEMLPLTNSYWKVKSITLDDKKQMVACLNVAFSVEEVRRKIKV